MLKAHNVGVDKKTKKQSLLISREITQPLNIDDNGQMN